MNKTKPYTDLVKGRLTYREYEAFLLLNQLSKFNTTLSKRVKISLGKYTPYELKKCLRATQSQLKDGGERMYNVFGKELVTKILEK